MFSEYGYKDLSNRKLLIALVGEAAGKYLCEASDENLLNIQRSISLGVDGLPSRSRKKIELLFELVKRIEAAEARQVERIGGSRDSYSAMKHIANLEVEEFHVVFLNRSNRIIGRQKISRGGMAGTVVDPKVVFNAALRSGCSSFVVAHNHPSGNLEPSQSDRKIVDQLNQGAKLLELVLLDSLIVSTKGYYSWADEGLL